MGKISSLRLTAICLVFVTSTATAFLTPFDNVHMDITPRAATNCSAPGFQSCNHSNLPANFCCPSGSECILFNDAKSVVCCPSGGDCKTIAPLTCDITQQNAALHPTNQLHSTDLSGTLDKCGSLCCPKGFSCQNSQCVMAKSVATASAPAAASTAKPSSAPTGIAINPNSTASQQNPIVHCDKFPVLAIITGFFPGVLLGVLLTVLIATCLGHRRNKQQQCDSSSDLGSVTAMVSDPIYQPQNNAFRTDFLRRDSCTNQQRSSRVRSFFSRSPTIRSPDHEGAPMGYKRPITPQMRKEPSTESIKIYSPPNGGLGRPNTTFTDMMQDAGFRPGDPYLANSPHFVTGTGNRGIRET